MSKQKRTFDKIITTDKITETVDVVTEFVEQELVEDFYVVESKPKFDKGDKVKIVNFYVVAMIGITGEIASIVEDSVLLKLVDGSTLPIPVNCLEKI